MLEREPLVIRGAVVAAVTALIHVLVILGVFSVTPDAESAIALAVDLIGTATLVIWTRGKVTPVAAPQIETPPAAAELPAAEGTSVVG
jgi:multisubunit Na+/H+ antiporter MnhC subunit